MTTLNNNIDLIIGSDHRAVRTHYLGNNNEFTLITPGVICTVIGVVLDVRDHSLEVGIRYEIGGVFQEEFISLKLFKTLFLPQPNANIKGISCLVLNA